MLLGLQGLYWASGTQTAPFYVPQRPQVQIGAGSPFTAVPVL